MTTLVITKATFDRNMALVLARSSLGGNVEWAIIELSKQLGELYHLLQSRRCNQNLFYFCWSFGHVR